MFQTKRYKRSGLTALSLVLVAGVWGCAQGSFPLTDSSLSGLIDGLSQSGQSSDDSPSHDQFDDGSGHDQFDDHGGHSGDDGPDDRRDGSDDSDGSGASAGDDSPGDGSSSSSDGSAGSAAADARLRASLDGPGEPHGEATYRVRDGRVQFKVEVEDMPAGTYAVRVNGVQVATIAVGASGLAEIEFDSKPEAGHVPLPATMPDTVQVGDEVTVGDVLSGTMVSDG